jgi:hypothetical protein
MALSKDDILKTDPRYDALRAIDDHSDSNTEVWDWDTEDVQPRRRRKTIWKRVKGHRWMLDTALLFVIVGLLVDKRWPRHTKSHLYELAGDVTGFAPTFSQQVISFKPDPVFAPEEPAEFWSNETQHAWLSIVPGMLPSFLVLHDRLTGYRGPRLRQRQRPRSILQPSAPYPRLSPSQYLHHLSHTPNALPVHHPRRLQHTEDYSDIAHSGEPYKDALAYKPLL